MAKASETVFSIDKELEIGARLATERAYKNIASRARNNIPLSKSVTGNKQWTIDKINSTIDKGLKNNWSAKELADQLKEFIDPNVAGGESFAAMRLARTEINNAFHETTREIARDSPFIIGEQWELSGSHDNDDDCDEIAEDDVGLGEGIYPPDDIPDKPHPNCFCFTTSVTPSISDFVDAFNAGEYDDWLMSEGFSE